MGTCVATIIILAVGRVYICLFCLSVGEGAVIKACEDVDRYI